MKDRKTGLAIETRWGCQRWLVVVGIIIISVVPSIDSLRADFVYDDSRAVLGNPVVQGEFDLLRVLRTDFWGQTREETHGGYRPLVTLSFIVDQHVGGGAAWTFHLTNILLHTIASALLLWVLFCRARDFRIAVVAALLFASHAVHSENVASIVARADVLATVFGLLVWRAWMEQRAPFAIVGGALLFLAFLAKEVAVVFLVVLAFETLVGWRSTPLSTHLSRIASGIAALAAYIALRMWAIGTFAAPVDALANPLVGATFIERLLTVASLAAHTVGLLLTPFVLSADYSYVETIPITSFWRTDVLLGLTVIGLFPVVLIKYSKERPLVALAALMLGAGYLLVSNLFFTIPTIYAERLLYLPSIGFCLLVAIVAARFCRRSPKIVTALLVLLVLGHCIRTAIRVEDWIDEERLFSSMTRTAPRSAVAWYNLGVVTLDADRPRDAAEHLSKAVTIHPSWGEAQTNLGIALALSGNDDEAHQAFTEALRVDSKCSTCAINLVSFYLMRRDLEEARETLERFREAGGDDRTIRRLERRLSKSSPPRR